MQPSFGPIPGSWHCRGTIISKQDAAPLYKSTFLIFRHQEAETVSKNLFNTLHTSNAFSFQDTSLQDMSMDD